MVYIREAHPSDSLLERGKKISLVEQHKTLEDKIDAANLLVELDVEHQTFTDDVNDKSKIPMLIDNMDEAFQKTYDVMPDRFVVIENNHVVFLGSHVSQQFQKGMLMTDEVRVWFEQRFSDKS
ncbi:thyroxine 5-deiodinase-like [Glandiceps talaboti]